MTNFRKDLNTMLAFLKLYRPTGEQLEAINEIEERHFGKQPETEYQLTDEQKAVMNDILSRKSAIASSVQQAMMSACTFNLKIENDSEKWWNDVFTTYGINSKESDWTYDSEKGTISRRTYVSRPAV